MQEQMQLPTETFYQRRVPVDMDDRMADTPFATAAPLKARIDWETATMLLADVEHIAKRIATHCPLVVRAASPARPPTLSWC